MSEPAIAPPEPAGRRRESWSLKSLVEEVGGRPIGDYQDPGRPAHPYVEFDRNRSARAAPAPVRAEEVGVDPVDRVYPPLSGVTGRTLHGSDHEHHAETLQALEHASTSPRHPAGPGPSRRPERVYLHYLLLHLDRLNDSALHYLRGAIDEELRHRSEPTPPPGT